MKEDKNGEVRVKSAESVRFFPHNCVWTEFEQSQFLELAP